MKSLIIIGNKPDIPWDERYNPISYDYKNAINSMDYVCRINRMNNYGLTGTKTDGLYIGGWKDYIYTYKGGDNVGLIPDIKDIFMVKIAWNLYFKNVYQQFITEEQKNNITFCNFDEGRIRMNYQHPCSVISMIDYFVNTPKWADSYKIYFTGIDVYNRAEVLATGEPWSKNLHKIGGAKERDYLLQLMMLDKIHLLEQEL